MNKLFSAVALATLYGLSLATPALAQVETSVALDQPPKFMSVAFSKSTGDWGFASNRSTKVIADERGRAACRNQRHRARDCAFFGFAQGGFVLLYACEGRTLTPVKLAMLADPDYGKLRAIVANEGAREGTLTPLCMGGVFKPQAIVDTSARGCQDDYNDTCKE